MTGGSVLGDWEQGCDMNCAGVGEGSRCERGQIQHVAGPYLGPVLMPSFSLPFTFLLPG